jgi:hypothetical protein
VPPGEVNGRAIPRSLLAGAGSESVAAVMLPQSNAHTPGPVFLLGGCSHGELREALELLWSHRQRSSPKLFSLRKAGFASVRLKPSARNVPCVFMAGGVVAALTRA